MGVDNSTPATPSWGRDTIERVAATFVMAFLATWLPTLVIDGGAVGNLADLGAAGQALVAAVAAALSLVKALLARRFGDPNSASLDPTV